MARKTDAYVDTSAFIAFLDRSDSHHALFRRLFAAPPPLTTSALVIAEGHGWFLRRYDQRRAIQFLGFCRELPALTILGFGATELTRSADLAHTPRPVLRPSRTVARVRRCPCSPAPLGRGQQYRIGRRQVAACTRARQFVAGPASHPCAPGPTRATPPRGRCGRQT